MLPAAHRGRMNETYDVVVIGGGAAGLAGAVDQRVRGVGRRGNLANIAAQVITSAAAGLTAAAAINGDLAAEDAKRAVGATPRTPATTASH